MSAVNKERVVSEKHRFVQLHSIVSSDMSRSLRSARTAGVSAALLIRWLPT